MLRSFARCFLLFLVATCFCFTAWAEDTWTEFHSPHFRIVSNGSAEDARKVALELEQMRFVLRWRFPGYRIDFDAPYTVYAARDFGTAFRLLPSWKPLDKPYTIDSDGDFVDVTRRAFFGNWERNVALVELDTWNKTSRDRLYAAYVHEILIQNVPSLPPWLDHGLSELIASSRISGNDIVMGSPIPGWTDLKARPLLPVSELLRPRSTGGWSNSEFLAWQRWTQESWAFVHFLTFSPGMGSGAKLLTLLRNLQAGQQIDLAFKAVFGDPAALDAPFRSYVLAKSLPAAVAPEFPALDPASFADRPLTRAQALTEEAIFHVETRRVRDGRTGLQQALQLDPRLAEAHEELGFLEYDDGNLADARGQWQAALTLDPDRYVSSFAMLMTGTPYHEQTPDQLQATLTELRRIVHLKPLFAPAYTQVAIVLWWQGKPDLALHAAMEAQRLAPNRGGYRLLVARLLLANGQPAQAAEIARRYVSSQGYITGTATAAFWQSLSSLNRDPEPVLAATLPPGILYTSGTLTRMNCGDWPSRTPLHLELHVSGAPAGQSLSLTAGDRTRIGLADTAWIGGGHDFVCRAAIGRPAQVLYKPGDKGYGELFAFSSTDDLPPTPVGNLASSSSIEKKQP